MDEISAPERLLFLPGALGSKDFWRPVSAQLRFAGERIFQAYPGFSGEPARADVNGLSDLVQLVSAAVDRPTHLVAQSMGGVLALQTALSKPQLVRSLVLTATSGGLDVAALGGSDWRAAFARNHPHLPDWFVRDRHDLSDRLALLTMPVLLIWGDADPISPITVGERLARLLPRAEWVVIAGGDHDVAQQHAALVAKHVQRHLDGMRVEYVRR